MSSVAGTLHSRNGHGVVRLEARYEAGLEDVWSAITDPARLAQWYGKVEGDLRVGGTYRAFVFVSEWDGRGEVLECDAPLRLHVSGWENEAAKNDTVVALSVEGSDVIVHFECSGLPLEWLWAFGAGQQSHLEDLGAHLTGESHDIAASRARFDDLEPVYKAMIIQPID